MRQPKVTVLPKETPEQAAARQRVEALARFLDDAFEIPGTRIRFGWDGLIGLIPGVGDAVGLILGAYLIVEAMRAGAPPELAVRMGVNTAIDLAVGAVPVVGDALDFAYKSNRKNARLLLEHLGSAPEPSRRRSRLWLIVTGVGVLTILVLLVWGVLSLASWLWHVRT